MQSVPVVVVLVSQHKCSECSQIFEDFISRSVCSNCGKPQPVDLRQDYFALLGVPHQFQQDLKVLEAHFYQLSRVLHPDRFSTASIEFRTLSLQRMSLINLAYSTLKNPTRLREYFLGLESINIAATDERGKSRIPVELAEAWFEIQDLMSENLASAQRKLSDFEGDLVRLKKDGEAKLAALEKAHDREPSRQILELMAMEIQTQSYLMSMEKDVERIKKNAYSN